MFIGRYFCKGVEMTVGELVLINKERYEQIIIASMGEDQNIEDINLDDFDFIKNGLNLKDEDLGLVAKDYFLLDREGLFEIFFADKNKKMEDLEDLITLVIIV